MAVDTKLSIFFLLLIASHVSSNSDLIHLDDDSINGFITFVIKNCNDDQYSCQDHLLELTTLSSSLSEARRRDLLNVVLKHSMLRVESVMIGVREDMNLLEEMMESAEDGLMRSLEELRGGSLSLKSYANVHTWLSGVLTSYMTCMDGISKGASTRSIQSELKDLVSRARVALAVFSSISPRDTEHKLVVPNRPSWLMDLDMKILDLTPEALKRSADLVVAKDGTGKYKTVKDAVAAAPEHSKRRFVIYVKTGVYKEIVVIGTSKTNLTLVGDGQDSTIISGSLSGNKTFYTATLAANGYGFIAQDLCIQNTAGPEKMQAVALRVSGDCSVIHRCRIDGYQDSLYAHQNRQFYRDCHIRGTVDFIFGYAAAVFQYCRIEARKPMIRQQNMITAQSRLDLKQNSGFSLQKCNITASSDLAPVKATVKTFLGRPWEVLSTVAVLESFIDDLVDPSGWAPWNGEIRRLSTLIYREFKNYGPGAVTTNRVKWKGYKVITDSNEAANFTVAKLLFRGGPWLNSTGVPYEAGL